MKRWMVVLLAAMMTLLQTGAFAESDDEILNYTRYTDYIPQVTGRLVFPCGQHDL